MNKDLPNENKNYLFRTSLYKGVSHHNLHEVRLRADTGVGKLSGGKKGRHVLLRACDVGKLEAG